MQQMVSPHPRRIGESHQNWLSKNGLAAGEKGKSRRKKVWVTPPGNPGIEIAGFLAALQPLTWVQPGEDHL
jgi:hypothetical protein